MAQSVCVILHWNADYAEIPRKEFPRVIQKSYRPMVQALEDFEGTICFNLTGHTIDYLLKQDPDLINSIRELVRKNVVEILLTGYSHPILPLLPEKRIEAQLKSHMDRVQEVFGAKPHGAWPPELAVSPLLLKVLLNLGIRWTAIDHEHFLLSQSLGNDINPFEKRKPTATEVMIKAYWSKGLGKLRTYYASYKVLERMNKLLIDPFANIAIDSEKSILALLTSVSWTYSTKFAIEGIPPIYSAKKQIKKVLKSKAPLLPLYGSDIEFFGYRALGTKAPKPEAFISFLQQLYKRGIKIISPSKAENHDWGLSKILGTGSWSPDKSLRIWTDSEDNRELTRRTDEIYRILDKLNLKESLKTQVESFLRIAENSDARGWAPLPERKHEAYSALLSIVEILQEERRR